MNEAQYNIVKSFHAMRAEPKKLAKVFGIDYKLVMRVYNSANYEHFNEADGFDSMSDEDFLKRFMGLGNA